MQYTNKNGATFDISLENSNCQKKWVITYAKNELENANIRTESAKEIIIILCVTIENINQAVEVIHEFITEVSRIMSVRKIHCMILG